MTTSLSVFEAKCWPGNRERAKNANKLRKEADRGFNIYNGPEFEFSFQWLLFSYQGLINLQIYFWLLKDMAWSQLKWFYLGIIFGSLAIILSILLILSGFYYKAYSESLLGIGFLGWLISNYIWMIGEIWGYKITKDSPNIFIPIVFTDDYYYGTDIFYNNLTEISQIISLITCIYIFIITFILPFCYYDRDTIFYNTVLKHTPRFRFKFFFRDFLEFENLHIFFWAIKDCFWIYDNLIGYYIFFTFTIIFMLDSIYITVTTKDHFIDFFHYILLLIWVLANFFWASGELYYETDEIKDEEWENYNFFSKQKLFLMRKISGFLYLFAVLLTILFYIYWIGFYKKTKELNEKEEEIEGELNHYELTQS